MVFIILFVFDSCLIFSLWDVRSREIIKKVKMDSPITSFDLSRDKSVLIVTHGKNVSFVDASRCSVCVLLCACDGHTCDVHVMYM